MRPYARHVLKRFELYLALGAAVFVGIVYWMFQANTDTGLTVAVTVIGMGLIQAAIQWADRERSARLRQRQIHEIREMLRDQVLNQLASVKMWISEPPDPDMAELLVDEVNESVDAIAQLIDQLSESQLNTWKLTYANAADHIAMTDAPLDAMPTAACATPGAPVQSLSAPRGRVLDVDALIQSTPSPSCTTDDAIGTMIVRADAPKEAQDICPSVAAWN